MPVILPREGYAGWLDPQTPEERLRSLLKSYPAEEMVTREASPACNDGPEVLGAARPVPGSPGGDP
jgi:putative SOS response-associated peptidase YedK